LSNTDPKNKRSSTHEHGETRLDQHLKTIASPNAAVKPVSQIFIGQFAA